jgi:hypothetical protein
MAVDVDRRKLRARHRVLRRHQLRFRLVVADGRRRQLGLPPFRRARPHLTGRLLRDDDGRRQADREQRTPETSHKFEV